MEIQGIEGLAPDEVRSRVSQGGRFVIFTWTVSFIVMTVRRPTAVQFINPGESAVLRSLPYTMISLVFGWWGIPWGFIYTPMSIIENLGGGRDVTNEMMQAFGAGGGSQPQVSPQAPPSDPGSAFGGQPGTMTPAPRLSDHTAVDGDAKAALYLGLGSLLCIPAGWLGLYFGIRAIGKARSHGLSAPGTAVVGVVLGSVTTVCLGGTMLLGVLVPKPQKELSPPVVSRPSRTGEATPLEPRDDGPVAEPGAAGANLQLTVVKSYDQQKPSAKPPYHVPGGEWTYLDLQGEDGVELTFGIHFKEVEGMFGFGSAELFASRAFAEAFDAKFGGTQGAAKAKKPAPLKMSVAILGNNVVRQRGGGFARSGEGTWVATKLFPEAGGRQGEVFFNYSVEHGRAEFSEKDAEYADDLSFVFHSAFAGK